MNDLKIALFLFCSNLFALTFLKAVYRVINFTEEAKALQMFMS